MVNDAKTEVVIFHRKEKIQTLINLDGVAIKTISELKFLGIHIQQDMSWSKQVHETINKCKRTLYGLKVIRKYFTEKEFKPLIHGLLYSRLFYCSEIWLSENLRTELKNLIMNVHINAIRIYLEDYNRINDKKEILGANIFINPFIKSNIATSILLFKLVHHIDIPEITTKIAGHIYINERKKHRPTFFQDRGKFSSNNVISRFSKVAKNIRFDWYDCDLTVNLFKKRLLKEYGL